MFRLSCRTNLHTLGDGHHQVSITVWLTQNKGMSDPSTGSMIRGLTFEKKVSLFILFCSTCCNYKRGLQLDMLTTIVIDNKEKYDWGIITFCFRSFPAWYLIRSPWICRNQSTTANYGISTTRMIRCMVCIHQHLPQQLTPSQIMYI